MTTANVYDIKPSLGGQLFADCKCKKYGNGDCPKGSSKCSCNDGYKYSEEEDKCIGTYHNLLLKLEKNTDICDLKHLVLLGYFSRFLVVIIIS